jgi:hypothetical protein
MTRRHLGNCVPVLAGAKGAVALDLQANKTIEGSPGNDLSLPIYGWHASTANGNAKGAWPARGIRQYAIAGGIETAVDFLYSSPLFLMFEAAVEAVTGLHLDSAIRALVGGALRFTCLLLAMADLVSTELAVVF